MSEREREREREKERERERERERGRPVWVQSWNTVARTRFPTADAALRDDERESARERERERENAGQRVRESACESE